MPRKRWTHVDAPLLEARGGSPRCRSGRCGTRAAERFELGADLGVVVDLAVEDELDDAVLVGHRLHRRVERSMIASRRKPRPTRPSSAIQIPAPSGPRCAIVSRMRVTRSSVTRKLPGRTRARRRCRTSRWPTGTGGRCRRGTRRRPPPRAARAAVPQRDRRRGARRLQHRRDLGDPLGVSTEQRVRPELDRHRPLGRVAQREARHAERGRLLLHAARVGEHEPRRRPRARGTSR